MSDSSSAGIADSFEPEETEALMAEEAARKPHGERSGG